MPRPLNSAAESRSCPAPHPDRIPASAPAWPACPRLNMVQCVNLAADSRRKPRGIAGRAHFQVHATDLIAQVSAIGLGQWDIEARPYSVAIAAKPAVPEGVQHGLITSRIQLVQHAQVRWAVNVGCPVEVASGVADHSVRVGSSGPAREAVQYRLLAGRIQLVHHPKARCPPPLFYWRTPPLVCAGSLDPLLRSKNQG